MTAFEHVIKVLHPSVFHRGRTDALRLQLRPIASVREGALSVLITRGNLADAFDRRVLTGKRFAAATFRFGEKEK
ncbi:hypothetical protein C627_07045 [Corynebacterium glutamicum ZL-6]|nr:hypothetical protein AC079_07215 [Corynebacterium glutamicum]ANR62374.1 hypothetical protein C628_07085 [[Brevibacterium] flavum ZL-1]ANR65380.1 hypothetical protein C627_07045 [Corynebacterium glutamicum ZL-6]PST75735.1 hypothetical protein I919_07161 [Corynebacterium glutamicum ZL-2]ANU33516.1 hypothetical protein BBD29_07010 [Corynebacterium glutamicum]